LVRAALAAAGVMPAAALGITGKGIASEKPGTDASVQRNAGRGVLGLK
jgi:hypothetical protein